MTAGYLLDAVTKGSGITFRFLDIDSNQLTEVTDTSYKPYFFLPYPLNPKDQEIVQQLHGDIEVTQKIDLYTNQPRDVAKISVYKPDLLKRAAKAFETAWETEIEFAHSYAYDHGLIFGVLHDTEHENHFKPVLSLPDNVRAKFNSIFGNIKDTDPLKHAEIENWFSLLHQPVPQVKPEMIGIKAELNVDKYLNAVLLSRIVNLPIPFTYTSRSVSDWLKSMIYNHLRRNNVLIPTSKELRRGLETHMVPGALTITPKSGLYFNTVVTDFESLYPSCIDSYNLSYETVDCNHDECKTNKISEIGHHICTKRRGFLAALVGALKDLRILWFKPRSKDTALPEQERHQAQITAKLLKLLTVSSYGVSVRIHGLACPPLAESITGYGRWALQTTWNMAEQNGLHPIYGDTDSVFLENPPHEKVEWLIKTVKEKLRLDLAVERLYPVCVLSKAKKAYFGILPDGTPDLKGLTAIKSNAPNFIQNVFKDCVKELSHVRTIQEFDSAKSKIMTIVQNAIKNLKDKKIPLKDLVYSVILYHDPREKLTSKVLPQPYQCAAQLIDSGKTIKQRDTVSFIKVRPFNYRSKQFTVKPADQVSSALEVNVEDYIRNLTTALNQTFNPMNITFETKKETEITQWLRKPT